MTAAVERHEFQAEVKQLLDLMVHSLYSDKDVFLRELISNASDALDKLRFEQLTQADLAGGELAIDIAIDRDARTLAIADNGIGMTRDEVVRNIGTIARSGTREFLGSVKATSEGGRVPPELIGQFGVGFYSAFMVAEKIVVETRRAGTAEATRWESTGDGAYAIGAGERAASGTTVTLHLRAPQEGDADYTDAAVIARIVKRYSDFVGYPIRSGGAALNSMKAIWDRPKSEVTDDEYHEFYRHISHDWSEPLRTIPIRIEGTLEAYALLYVPAKAPFDLYSAEMKRGLQLYVKRVFVMDECKELLPPWLRFVRGVVDAHDLSLNVSREILQKDRQIAVIRKQLVKKVLATLDELKREASERYLEVWAAFGPVIKEGLLDNDADRDKLLELVVAPTQTTAKPSSLADYIARMKPEQDAIYALAGGSHDTLAKSPLLEAFTARGYEVALLSDPVDELWLERELTYNDKPIRSIGRGTVELGSDQERKQAADTLADKSKQLGELVIALRVALQDDVKEVRLSNRLTTSAVCLVADAHDLTPRMQRMFEALGHAPPKAKPVLEVNPDHPLIGKLNALAATDKSDPRLAWYATLLLGQAYLADTGQLPDPSRFAAALGDVMLRGL